jgi:cysteine desulfurase
MKRQIFLDNASTTPLAKEVSKGVLLDLECYGNPSSKHFLGEMARKKIELCRREIAEKIHCNPEEIFFTSGGTEGNNMILKGLASRNSPKRHILVSSIEHSSVLETSNYLEGEGFTVERIPVDGEGIVRLERLNAMIREDTLLVSVMHINNEVGTIQPIEEIAKMCRGKGVYFHSDMVQSLGKLELNLRKIDLDFASFSGHKINALKGTGFVFIRRGTELVPLIHGGHQEDGRRSGTENFLGILSLARAIKLRREKEAIRKKRDRILKEILQIPGTRVNGSLKKRVYNNINVSFYGIEGESLMTLLSQEGICVSTGSACSSYRLAESHVLKAMEVESLYINGSIRITLGDISEAELKYFVRVLRNSVKRLREISPFKIDQMKTLNKLKEVK